MSLSVVDNHRYVASMPLDLRDTVAVPQSDYGPVAAVVVERFAGVDAPMVLRMLGLASDGSDAQSSRCPHCDFVTVSDRKWWSGTIARHVGRAHPELAS